jgi:hypothetical protein
MLSGAFGASVCLLLVLGIVYSERLDSSSAGVSSVAGQSDQMGGSSPLAMNDPLGHAPGFAVTGTNGASPELNALFNQLPLQSVPAAASGSVMLPTK